MSALSHGAGASTLPLMASGLFGAAVLGAEAYLTGGLAQWSAHYAADFAAAVAGGN